MRLLCTASPTHRLQVTQSFAYFPEFRAGSSKARRFGPCVPPPLPVGEHSRRIEHGAVLFVEVGERHTMYFISRAQATMEISAREGEACIRD
jgi:hypothetical protein